jgi:ketosteroid isomerase-like protein
MRPQQDSSQSHQTRSGGTRRHQRRQDTTTTTHVRTPREAAQEVAALQQAWILGWDKTENEALRPFREVLDRYYDFGAPVILFDDFDPQRREFRTVQDYADAFWPGFAQLRSAAHAIEAPPEVVVEGDLAATRMVFIAVLTEPDGTVVANRATNSQVWRRTEGLGWRIVRDHTGVEAIPVDEARRAFPTQ